MSEEDHQVMCDYAFAHNEGYKELMKRSRNKGIEQILEAIKKQLELESKKASGHEPASPIAQDSEKILSYC